MHVHFNTKQKEKQKKKDGALYEVLRTIQIQRLSFHLLHGPYILKCCVTSSCRSLKEGRDKLATTWAGTVCTVSSALLFHDHFGSFAQGWGFADVQYGVESIRFFFLCVYVQKLKETFQTLLLSFDSEDSAKFTAISSEVNLLWCFVFLFYNLMLRTSAGTPQGLIWDGVSLQVYRKIFPALFNVLNLNLEFQTCSRK